MNAIEELKKYDLHCHLDGSLSEAVIRKLASGAGVDIPAGEKLMDLLQVQPDCKNIWKSSTCPCPVWRTGIVSAWLCPSF